MTYYRCTIIPPGGKKTVLIKTAANEQELIASFIDTDYLLVKFIPVEESAIIHSKKNYSRETVMEFTEIMTSLLKSGMTVQDAVFLCGSIASNTKTAWLSKDILKALQNGQPLHAVLKTHSPSFSPLYQSLVRLGEQTGSVAAVFHRMSAYLRNEKKLRGKIGNVLWYPALVLGIAVAGSIGIMVFILPRMAEIFAAFNVGADEGTALELARVYHSVWISVSVLAAFIAAVIGSVILRKRSEHFAYLLDYMFLTVPLLGGFIKAIQTMDFAFAMEMLTGAGINVHTALQESASVVRNRAYSKALASVHAMLLKGEALSAAFAACKEFPPYIATWVAVGERTGTVEPVFTQIREYFQGGVDSMSERLMGLLEPLLILVVGIIVLVMILQFVLPLFSLYGRLL